MGSEQDPTPAGDDRWLEWLEQARQGDGLAANQLAGEVRGYLRRRLAQLLGDRFRDKADASDAAQECFVNWEHKLEQFRGQTIEELRGWLNRMAENEAHTLHRRWCGAQRDAAREEPLPADAGGGEPLRTDDTSVPGAVAREEEAQRLRDAIGRLPPHDRLVIDLVDFQDQTWAEVAAALGKSEPAAKQAYYRAVRRLRKEMGGEP
jgi:RNA polymerase sigma-70 factor (ECF subfamily)